MKTIHLVLSVREIDGVSVPAAQAAFSSDEKAWAWIRSLPDERDSSFTVQEFVVDEWDEDAEFWNARRLEALAKRAAAQAEDAPDIGGGGRGRPTPNRSKEP